MQYLAEIVKSAILRGTVTEDMLYETESKVIAALTSDDAGRNDWESFRKMSRMERSDRSTGYPVRKINAKKRYIDPFVAGKGRVSVISDKFRILADAFREETFDYFITCSINK